MQLCEKVGGALSGNGGDRTGIGNQIQLGPALFRDTNAFRERTRQMAANDGRQHGFTAPPRVPSGEDLVGGKNVLQGLRRSCHVR